VSGDGTVIEPEDGLMSVGSGGLYALASAKTLLDMENVDAEEIARKAMYAMTSFSFLFTHLKGKSLLISVYLRITISSLKLWKLIIAKNEIFFEFFPMESRNK
jgi:hypothetical protein